MTEELFEKRILFETLACILANQQAFIEYLQATSKKTAADANEAFKERIYMTCLIEQCCAIVEQIRWAEAMERDKNTVEDLCQKQ